MKTKLFKRIGTLVLACALLLSLSTTAFAADYTQQLYVGAGQTVDVKMGFTTSKTATIRISSTDNGTILNKTIKWGVHRENEPNFMSGTTKIGDTFQQGGIYFSQGTYYIKVTNNSSKSVWVILSL